MTVVGTCNSVMFVFHIGEDVYIFTIYYIWCRTTAAGDVVGVNSLLMQSEYVRLNFYENESRQVFLPVWSIAIMPL